MAVVKSKPLRVGYVPLIDCTAIRTLSSGAVFRMDLFAQAKQLIAHANPELPSTDALELATA